jgi:hypothetical protein
LCSYCQKLEENKQQLQSTSNMGGTTITGHSQLLQQQQQQQEKKNFRALRIKEAQSRLQVNEDETADVPPLKKANTNDI